MISVNLMHILLIGPVMIYINFNRESDLFKKMLVGISLMIPFIVNVPNIKKLYITYQFINFVHWTAILGYFLYVSYLFAFNKNTSEYIYISLAIVGVIIILIHLYKLIPKLFSNKNIQDKKKYFYSKL
tara:strand:- start:294 stop:677 length:384 start_codon:yes stop_codon:yes gene_type:complete